MFFFLFTYIGGATFIYQEVYHLDADAFGLVFGGTGIAVMIGAIVSGRTVQRFGAGTLAVVGSVFVVVGGAMPWMIGMTAAATIALVIVGVSAKRAPKLAELGAH